MQSRKASIAATPTSARRGSRIIGTETDVQEALAKKDADVREMVKTLEAKDKELDQLLALLNQSEGRVTSLNKQLHSAQQAAIQSKREHDQLLAAHGTVCHESAQFKLELESAQYLLATERERNSALQEQRGITEHLLGKAQQTENKLRTLEGDYTVQTSELKDCRARVSELQQEVDRLVVFESQVLRLQEELNMREKQSAEVRARADGLLQSLAQKTDAIAQLRLQLEQQGNSYQSDQEQVSRLLEERAAEIASLREEKLKLELDLDNSRVDQHDTLTRMLETQDRADAAIRRATATEQSLTQEHLDRVQLEERVAELELELGKRSDAIAVLRHEVSDLRSREATFFESNRDLQAKLEEIQQREAAVAEQDATFAPRHKALQDREDELQAREAELQRARELVDARDVTLVVQTQELQAREARVAEQEGAAALVREQLNACERRAHKLDEREAENNHQERIIAGRQADLDRRENQLRVQQTALDESLQESADIRSAAEEMRANAAARLAQLQEMEGEHKASLKALQERREQVRKAEETLRRRTEAIAQQQGFADQLRVALEERERGVATEEAAIRRARQALQREIDAITIREISASAVPRSQLASIHNR
eukprot:TRINITY_DN6231_c0_g2_i1.p1 TRINITY_DN6231_c0_g2~~TRINITY_DN6231_c0_g2_i1.p1  ORF type:complete len:609 (-),score=172.76 TRINITY_DN6231_c0_g2_i1:33-1859(-)